MRLKEKSKNHPIPIYEMELEVVVTNSIPLSLKKREEKFHQENLKDTWIGLWCFYGSLGGLLFKREELNHNLIAHEVIHAVHAIMEINGVRFGPRCCHETPAMLCGFISDLVYKDINSWRVKIK